MRTRRDLVVAVDVAAPAATVWDLVTDWERQREWILATRVRVVSGDGRSPGSVVVAVTGVGDVGVVDTMTVRAFEPAPEGGGRVDVRHTGLVVTGDSSFVVAAQGADRCRFTWTEGLELPFGRLGALGWPLVGPVTAAGFRMSLRRLARLAETVGPTA
ncbi:SRPBCC family protein [Pseudonocardia halophobica]|uniref:Polyketide cyclase n=1 Tax=Pseudonocardia halophobica TaxID=29401 RepID=A0A9W6NXU6_9PSEU|nr:SRPBCC family protein [Pseudonocardia halophobica]GLL13093.1 polyketide cyclase [Pseudonocardia halophobica]